MILEHPLLTLFVLIAITFLIAILGDDDSNSRS